MISELELSNLKSYLENLLMVTLAFEDGVNVDKALKNPITGRHHQLHPSTFESGYNDMGNFLFQRLCMAMLEHTEFYDSSDDCLDKAFWYKKVTGSEDLDKRYLYIFVLEDKYLRINEHYTVEGEDSEEVSLYPYDLGIVVIFDEDYGFADWTMVFKELVDIRNKNKLLEQKEGEITNEMAI